MRKFKLDILAAFSLALLLSAWSIFAATQPVFAFSSDSNGSLAPNRQAGSHLSSNWSGYSIVGNDITQVQGSWTVPSVEGTNLPLSGSAEWIGIGGITDDDLIQVGTEAFAEDNGQVFYQAFYETLPDVADQVSMKVDPGDEMSASIEKESSSKWLIELTDKTTGSQFSKELSYDSSSSSAEWIEEMPLNAKDGSLIPLNDFGKVTFSDAGAVMDKRYLDLRTGKAVPITMINGRSVLATPSDISSDGESFDISRSDVEFEPQVQYTTNLSGRSNWHVFRIVFFH